MTYRSNIQYAKLFSSYQKGTDKIPYIGGGDAFQRMRRNVFFARSYRTKPTERIWTIRDIMEKWGVLKHYEALIDNMEQKTSSNEVIAIVEWNGSTDELYPAPSEQKILNWGIYDENTGNTHIYGGIVFQNGKMTFHT